MEAETIQTRESIIYLRFILIKINGVLNISQKNT